MVADFCENKVMLYPELFYGAQRKNKERFPAQDPDKVCITTHRICLLKWNVVRQFCLKTNILQDLSFHCQERLYFKIVGI